MSSEGWIETREKQTAKESLMRIDLVHIFVNFTANGILRASVFHIKFSAVICIKINHFSYFIFDEIKCMKM